MGIAQLRAFVGQRQKVAAEIATGVTEFERDLARALASGGRLTALLPLARMEADVSPVVGQDAIKHIVGSVNMVQKAMGKSVKGHHSLAELAKTFRVDVTAAGDKGDIPPIKPMAVETPSLRVVEG